MAAAPFLKFTLLNLKLRKEALYQGSFVVSQQLDDAHLGVNELAANLAAGDDSVPRKIISHAAQLPNSDTYWREQKRELDALHVFRRAEDGDLPTDFKSLSMAELWWPELEAVLADFVERTRGAAAAAKVRGPAETNAEFDPAFKRRMLLESGHVVAAYFDARTCNYFSTVGRELYEIDDVWWRYEFAKSRGAVHAHALLSSLRRHLRRKAALRRGYEAAAGQQDFAGLSQEARVREQQAQELEEVLQGDVAESLGLASMHPAGALPLQGLPRPPTAAPHHTPSTPHHAPSHPVTPRHATSRHVTPRHATSRHVTPVLRRRVGGRRQRRAQGLGAAQSRLAEAGGRTRAVAGHTAARQSAFERRARWWHRALPPCARRSRYAPRVLGLLPARVHAHRARGGSTHQALPMALPLWLRGRHQANGQVSVCPSPDCLLTIYPTSLARSPSTHLSRSLAFTRACRLRSRKGC